MRNRRTFFLITTGLLLALLSLPFSAALNQEHMVRETAANLAPDASAVLTLDGFENPTLVISNINKKYFHLGSIKNNTNQTINLTVMMVPDFSLQNNKSYWLGVRIGTAVSEFSFGSSPSLETGISIAPGQVIEVQGALTNNQARSVTVSYSFNASAADGTYSMQLSDTALSPRRMTLR